METYILNPLSYQELNVIFLLVMLTFALFGVLFLKSIQQNFSKFLLALVSLYSVALICDAIKNYYEGNYPEKVTTAFDAGVVYCICMLLASAMWLLYALTRLHPATNRNYIVYTVAGLPATLVTIYDLVIMVKHANAVNAGIEIEMSRLGFILQESTVVVYYFLALLLGVISIIRLKGDKRVDAAIITMFPVPYLITNFLQGVTGKNYQSLGLTLSVSLFLCVVLNRRGRAQKRELTHFSNIMDSLKNQYATLIYANLKTDEAEPYLLSDAITGGEFTPSVLNSYSILLKEYCSNIVYSSDRDKFCENVAIENVVKQLETSDRFSFEYRIAPAGEIINMRMDYWRTKDDVDITHVVMGFVNISEEKQHERAEKKKSAIINGLVNSFEYVCYVNYGNGECEEYHVSKEFDYYFNVIGEVEPLKRFIAIFKHGMSNDEYKIFRERFDQNVILDEVLENGTYSIECKINLGKGVKHYNVIAIGNADNPEAVVFGLVDIDEQVRAEIEKKERIKEKEYSIQLEKTISERTAELHEKAKSLNQINEDITELLGNITEARDTESGTHIKRVKGYTKILATHIKDEFPEYGLDDEMIALITSASALHDIGKIMIPDSILRKPGKFTPEEFDVMKSHCEKGCEMLKMAPKGWDKKYLGFSMEICRYHHEKWDGKGYPEGLKEDEIPISAQIVSIADCFDALTTKRVYKDAYELEEAFNMIVNGECGCFSKKMITAFSNAKEEFFKQFFGSNEVEAEIPNLISAKALKGMNILLVEDNELTREITSEILEDEGAAVKAISNGTEALAEFEDEKNIEYDAILMDLTLPDISGFEVTDRIRSMDIARAKEVPIIAITSSTDKNDMQKAFDAKMSAFMPKPISVSKLTAIILSSMRSEQINLKNRLDEAIMRANKDPLTGVKNMTAYTEAVGELTAKIAAREEVEFAIVMCDVNKLKTINDNFGHDMGDRYIRNCCKLICDTYDHSPVYRIGGDEFAVILTGTDYANRNTLIDDIGASVLAASAIDRIEDGKAKMAVGMAVYNPFTDFSVASVTKRADESMYNNKRMMEFGGMYQ